MVDNIVKYYQGHLQMKDFLEDDLKNKEIPSKQKETEPHHHHISDFDTFIGMGINI